MKYTIDDITVIILAGGQGKRLGNQNKGLLKLNSEELNSETFVSHLIKLLSNQSKTQIISANNDLEQYKKYKKTVIQDLTNDQGPLSGIISCKAFITTPLVLTVPCDSPLIPDNLSQRLLDTYNQQVETKLCVVHDGTQLQNLFMLFDISLLDDMETYFHNGERKVRLWIDRQQHLQRFQSVDFSDKAINFTNVNDKNTLKALLSLQQVMEQEQ